MNGWKTKGTNKKINICYSKNNFMKVTKKLYFAYGSNMNQERLEERVGKVTKLYTTAVMGWKLDLNCGPRDKRFANMTMTGLHKDFVEGVVYELTPKQLRWLDCCEGAPVFYQRIEFPLEGTKSMIAYISLNPTYRSSPKTRASKDYIYHLIKGCKDNNLEHTEKTLISLINSGLVHI
jgi:gamma-glutamylcyclotransferase